MNIHPASRHSFTDARRKSAVLSRPSQQHQQQPPHRPVSLCLSMDRSELSAKIAESFQEFSVMLDKMSAPTAAAAAAAPPPPPPTPPPPRSSTLFVRRASSAAVVQPVRQSTSSLSSSELSASTWSASSRCASPTPLQTQAEDKQQEEEFSNPAQYDALYRLSSTGKVQELDELIRDGMDINAPNKRQYGTTALMYAACFGHVECMRLLLKAGANIDAKDEKGWTALMWAICNNHTAATSLLVQHGASLTSGSMNALDFVDDNNMEIHRILPPRPRRRASTVPNRVRKKDRPKRLQRSASVAVDEIDRVYYQADINGYIQNAQQRQEQEHYADDIDTSDDDHETDSDAQSFESSIRSIYQFSWDKCLLDQMFVFTQDDMSRIIDTIISDCTKSTLKSQDDLHIPSDVLFLCCRYAHYHSNRELLHAFLNLALTKITKSIKSNARQMQILCFWISNLHRLLLYLKRDAELINSSLDAQTRITALIDDTYHLVVADCTRHLEKTLEPGMLEFEACSSGKVEFADDETAWRRLFRRSSSGSNILSPYAITTSLMSIIHTLQMYNVHPGIIDQVIGNIVYFISKDLYFRILGNKKYLCRSKALQIRMNVSVLEDWLQCNHYTEALTLTGPLTQLLQLLQCMSQQQTARAVQDAFPLLSTEDICRCIENYRYEVGEPRLISVAQLDAGRVSCEMPRNTKFSLPLTPSNPRPSVSNGRRSISDDIYNEVWKQKHEKKQEWKMMPSISLEWLRKLDRK